MVCANPGDGALQTSTMEAVEGREARMSAEYTCDMCDQKIPMLRLTLSSRPEVRTAPALTTTFRQMHCGTLRPGSGQGFTRRKTAAWRLGTRSISAGREGRLTTQTSKTIGQGLSRRQFRREISHSRYIRADVTSAGTTHHSHFSNEGATRRSGLAFRFQIRRLSGLRVVQYGRALHRAERQRAEPLRETPSRKASGQDLTFDTLT